MKKIIFLMMMASGLLAGQCEGFSTTADDIDTEVYAKELALAKLYLEGKRKLPWNKFMTTLSSQLTKLGKKPSRVLCWSDCRRYVSEILRPFQDSSGIVVVSRRTLNKIRGRAFSFMHTTKIAKYLVGQATRELLEEMYRESQQQHLRCDICKDQITQSSRIMLPCSHVFCIICDNQITQNRTELPCSHEFCIECSRAGYSDLSIKEEQQGGIFCPTCNKTIPIHSIELGENEKLYREFSSLKKKMAQNNPADSGDSEMDQDSQHDSCCSAFLRCTIL